MRAIRRLFDAKRSRAVYHTAFAILEDEYRFVRRVCKSALLIIYGKFTMPNMRVRVRGQVARRGDER